MTDTGLRDRKKLETRALLVKTARALFAERGFDEVSVSEIARVAGVSQKTVFNYFPTKERLVTDGDGGDVATLLLLAVRERAAGTSALAAVRARIGGLLDPAGGRKAARKDAPPRPLLDAGAPASLWEDRARVLAQGLAMEITGEADDARPRLLATWAITSLRHAVDHAGSAAQLDAALALLDRALADYGKTRKQPR